LGFEEQVGDGGRSSVAAIRWVSCGDASTRPAASVGTNGKKTARPEEHEVRLEGFEAEAAKGKRDRIGFNLQLFDSGCQFLNIHFDFGLKILYN
jgi:hypothetical protein